MFFKRSFLVLLLPIMVLIALRVPSVFESYWYGDEGIYAAVAQELSQGKKLYQDVWDHKPPLIFSIYYPGALLGWEIGFPLLKVFNIILGLLTLVFVNFTLLKVNVGKKLRFLALLFLSIFLGSTVLEGNSLNAEVVFVVFNALALLLLLYKKYFVVAGILIFLSLMTKVPGFVEMFLVSIVFLVIYWKEEGFSFVRQFVGRVLLGFSVPLLMMLVYFYLRGTLWDFVDANVIFNIVYSLHEDNYSSILGFEIPNTLLKLLSVVLVFAFSFYLLTKKRLSSPAFLIVNLFTAQVFGSLLSGKNYGHYFIQILPGMTLLFALATQKIKDGVSFGQIKTALVLIVLLLPAFFAFRSVGEVPVYAPPAKYYSSFFKGYVLGGEAAKENFWWRNGEGIRKTKEFSKLINRDYLEHDTVYIYTNKPWVIALVEREVSNKYVTWFHLSYRAKHLNEEIENIRESDLFIVDNDVLMVEPVAQELTAGFEKIGIFDNFDIYKKK